jgi:hypothetical protein
MVCKIKKTTALLAAFVFSAAPLCAQFLEGPLKNGDYACNGTSFIMHITMPGASGMATLYSGGKIVSNALITVKDGTVIFTFNTGTQEYRGKSWFYTLTSDVSFSGNGETWMRINDGAYSAVKPGGGSITNPKGDDFFKLQSGSYTLSGSRQRMRILVSDNRGHGALWDERGNAAGNFDLRIDKDTLSIFFTDGPSRGITSDYRITAGTSFSRRGETWIKRE